MPPSESPLHCRLSFPYEVDEPHGRNLRGARRIPRMGGSVRVAGRDAQIRLVRSVELAEQRTDVRDLPRLDDQPVAECANTGGLHPVESSQRRCSAGA